MRRLPPLSALRAFEAAARHGSFKQAASELAVTPTAISHQVRLLEEQLGLALFERKVRQVVLTDAGMALFPVLRDGFNAFEAALHGLRAPPPRQRVTISATRALTGRWLAPRVAAFASAYPEIDLELAASDRPADLAAGEADIAIRYGQGPYAGMVSQPLFRDRFAPLASPSLGLLGQEDLNRVPLIDFTWRREHPANPTWQHWFAEAGLPWQPRHGRLLFSDEDHAIQAALTGQGIALLSVDLLAGEIAAGQLAQPFGPDLPGHTYHLVRSAGRPATAHVDAVVSWLVGVSRGGT